MGIVGWARKRLSIGWLKLAISLAAITAIVLRLVFPDLKIDSVTLGLMVVAVLPWLTELIESATFPGGWEVKFREIKEAGDKITAAADAKADSDKPRQIPPKPSFASVADLDPNLALVGLRIEIELRIRQLATQHGIPDSRRSLGGLLQELRRREVLPFTVASGLDDLVVAGNQAAHGAKVEPEVATWAIDYGPTVLAALDDLLQV